MHDASSFYCVFGDIVSWVDMNGYSFVQTDCDYIIPCIRFESHARATDRWTPC